MENVVLRLHDRMAGVPAVRKAFRIGSVRAGCGIVIDYRISPAASLREFFAVLFHDESLAKDVWNIHGELGLRALLWLPLQLHDLCAFRKSLTVAWDARLVCLN